MKTELPNFEGKKPIGKGREKTVYDDPDNPKRVVALFEEKFKESPRQSKARFYLTKIVHLLYPDIIPDIHQAGTTQETDEANEETFTVAEKVKRSRSHLKLQKEATKLTSEEMETRRASEKFYKLVDKHKIEVGTAIRYRFYDQMNELGIWIDRGVVNFDTRDWLRRIYKYFETFKAWTISSDGEIVPNFSAGKLEKAIQEMKAEEDKRRALIYLDRLQELLEEEKAN